MSKWFQHEEHAAIQAAVNEFRRGSRGPKNASEWKALGETLANRTEQALRSTDWRRVEGQAEQDRLDTYIAQEDVRLGIEPDPQDGGGG